jgi:hypothetical protein
VDLDVRPVFDTFMAMTCTYLVELPGIEPAPKMVVSCGNVEFNDAKRRETTRNDLRIRAMC